MSSKNWVAAGRKISRAAPLGALLLLAACAGNPTPEQTAPPTQPLIPATATFTPTAVPPTVPPQTDLAAPGDLVTPTADSSVPNSSAADLLASDFVAADLAAVAQRRIAQETGLAPEQVEVVEVEAYVWEDTSLGCPLPGQTYSPAQVDGYRIVLEAGGEQYLFHTDFDRAIPCDFENERLPAG